MPGISERSNACDPELDRRAVTFDFVVLAVPMRAAGFGACCHDTFGSSR
jgi:hypothetical protein